MSSNFDESIFQNKFRRSRSVRTIIQIRNYSVLWKQTLVCRSRGTFESKNSIIRKFESIRNKAQGGFWRNSAQNTKFKYYCANLSRRARIIKFVTLR